MIHLLYQELSDVYRTVLLSFLALEYIESKRGSELLLIDHKLAGKQLNDKQIRIGKKEKCRRLLTDFYFRRSNTKIFIFFVER